MIGFIKKFINSDFTKPLNTLIDEVKATLALIKAKTDTITADLFTSTHASRIDATISSRQASWGATSTHASRIDESISSRASQASVDAIKAKTDALTNNLKSTMYFETFEMPLVHPANFAYTVRKTITGKGKLHLLYPKTNTLGSDMLYIRVKVDGAVIYEGNVQKNDANKPFFAIATSNYFQSIYNGTSDFMGFVFPLSAVGTGESSISIFPSSGAYRIKFITPTTVRQTESAVILLEEPLPFNSSITIESASSSTNGLSYDCDMQIKYELLT